MEKPEHTERMNYCITSQGTYIGQLVNMPGCITQAATLPELEVRMKAAMKTMLSLLAEGLDRPFAAHEMTVEAMTASQKP